KGVDMPGPFRHANSTLCITFDRSGLAGRWQRASGRSKIRWSAAVPGRAMCNHSTGLAPCLMFRGRDMADDRWFRRYRPVPECRLRLVCFPHAGGSASAYRSWPDSLPGDIELLAVRYPGRQDRLREPCLTSVAELADAVTGALTPYLDRPVALFGHSMGAS